MKKIKLIIFDLYGLILNQGYPNTVKFLVRKFGGKQKKYYEILYKKYFNMAAIRKITQRDAWKLAIKELNLPIDWRELREIHYNLMKLDKRLIDLNKKLTKQGFTTLVLSKNTRSQLSDTCKRFQLRKKFKNIINTWELNLPKASKETLKIILKRFRVKPEETIYADDQKINLVDAKKIGIKTILVKNYKQFKKELDKYLYN
jgi:HAD superfamily hydrolase (TIGR01509 family)